MAGPSIHGSSTSGKVGLRNGKKHSWQCGVRKIRTEQPPEKQPCRQQGEKWRRGAVCTGIDSFTAHWVGVEQTPTLQPMEDPWWRRCVCPEGNMKRTYNATREKCEIEVAERSCYGLTETPNSCPLCLHWDGKVEDLGKKAWSWAWEKRGLSGGKKVFKFLSLFLTVQINFTWKLNDFFPTEPALPITVIIVWSPCPYLALPLSHPLSCSEGVRKRMSRYPAIQHQPTTLRLIPNSFSLSFV